ncbi:hypothetical protein [Sphingobacterium pedocola]|uniref:Uncharacterized protein n=1 Tax=Sphingobacterium pedocola TaxID=2082722 RepID=A0ABR9T987_9SPHI|nr:hypothetical protein [Sphingobacterium pedocola]MBE8721572.1 hypothetical protein [Sphingobacterium pedocola]
MLNYLQEQRLIRSRIEGVREQETNPTVQRRLRLSLLPRSIQLVLLWLGLIGGTAFGYVLLGLAVQRVDPTAGWLDIGTLSLPLFAAWSCLMGWGIAGLLPALLCKIGRKGGIGKWRRSMNGLLMLVSYIGYIAVLCALL